MDIPVLDISSVDPQVGGELVDAAERYGFVFIKNTGIDISPDEIERIFGRSQEFFSSPEGEKAQYRITENNKGWSSMHTEVLDHGNQTGLNLYPLPFYLKPEIYNAIQQKGDFKEAFNMGDFLDGKAQQPLPPTLAPFEAEVDHFASVCRELCMKILRLFALGLKIDSSEGGQDWFSTRHDLSTGEPSGSILRFLHYPTLPPSFSYNPETDIRAGAHSDYGSVTLLFQRPAQPGLEILSPAEEDPPSWSSVPVSPPGTEHDAGLPILVNIGDMLSDWTEGLLKSTVHRVVFPSSAGGNNDDGGKMEVRDRYSIAYFCHPLDSTPLVPVPSERVRERERATEKERIASTPQRDILTAKQHLEKRLAATYGWETSTI